MVIYDEETGLYGIGGDGWLVYEPTMTYAQAWALQSAHDDGAETFEEAIAMIAKEDPELADSFKSE